MTEKNVLLVWNDKVVSVWSPHDAFEGAATLLRALKEDREDSTFGPQESESS